MNWSRFFSESMSLWHSYDELQGLYVVNYGVTSRPSSWLCNLHFPSGLILTRRSYGTITTLSTTLPTKVVKVIITSFIANKCFIRNEKEICYRHQATMEEYVTLKQALQNSSACSQFGDGNDGGYKNWKLLLNLLPLYTESGTKRIKSKEMQI